MKTNRTTARKLVKEKYGPSADVVAVSNVKNRHERFGVVFTEPGGKDSAPVLMVLGHGDSFQAALDHADQNEASKLIAKRWEDLKLEFKEFGENPQEYIKKMNQKAEELKNKVLENTHGRDQAESSQSTEVSGDEGRPGETHQEEQPHDNPQGPA